MSEPKISIQETDVRSEAALALLQALTTELVQRYGDDGGANHFKTSDMDQAGSLFCMAYENETPIACGAIRPLKGEIGELKRMYVRPAFRGRGLSKRILAFLEQKARDFGYTELWLETGTEQPEAIALYQQAGYRRIPVYGYYKKDPRSRCFGKQLG